MTFTLSKQKVPTYIFYKMNKYCYRYWFTWNLVVIINISYETIYWFFYTFWSFDVSHGAKCENIDVHLLMSLYELYSIHKGTQQRKYVPLWIIEIKSFGPSPLISLSFVLSSNSFSGVSCKTDNFTLSWEEVKKDMSLLPYYYCKVCQTFTSKRCLTKIILTSLCFSPSICLLLSLFFAHPHQAW